MFIHDEFEKKMLKVEASWRAIKSNLLRKTLKFYHFSNGP